MKSEINLTAIYIANIMGILLLFIMILGNTWKLKSDLTEEKNIRRIMLTTFIACIVDPIVFTLDGKPGILSFIAVYGGNLFLFIAGILNGVLWIKIIARHTSSTIGKKQKVFIGTLLFLGMLTLLINFFVPIVFKVNSNNVYSRESWYFIYIIIDYVFYLYGVVIYVIAKIKGGVFKFFPVWQFIVPIIVGMVLQMFFYGVSTTWPCAAISISGIIYSLQNETVYFDLLTGLYNRFYLENVKREIMKKKTGNITAMMLDMNDFKSINDKYGHAVGDDALQEIAAILREVVGNIGSVIRYAGDEFVILLNTQQKETLNDCVIRINEKVDRFNQSSGKPYQLSLAIGYCSLDLKKQTIDELFNDVDQRMYDNKKKYYDSFQY